MPVFWREDAPPSYYEYESYYHKIQSSIADLAYHCRFAWDSLYHFRWAIVQDCLIQASFGSETARPFLLMPLGELTTEKLERIIRLVREDFSARGLPLTVCGIDEAYLPLFDAMRIPHEAAAYSDDFSDYLYLAEALRTLSGRKYAKKRNHLTHFMKAYPDHVYERLTETHFEGCLELARSWSEEKRADISDPAKNDYPMIETMFTHWDRLNARGGVILLDGRVSAFSIGSCERDTAFIHFEKADAAIDGLYTAINQMVLQHEFPEAVFVNREDDMGIEGLRHAKRSYFPIKMIRKYQMEIK